MHQLAGFSKKKTTEEFDITEDYEPATVIVMCYLCNENSLSESLIKKEHAPHIRKNVLDFVKFLDN